MVQLQAGAEKIRIGQQLQYWVIPARFQVIYDLRPLDIRLIEQRNLLKPVAELVAVEEDLDRLGFTGERCWSLRFLEGLLIGRGASALVVKI